MMDDFKCDFCKFREYTIDTKTIDRLGLKSEKFKIVKCQKCHLVALFPQPSEEELFNFYAKYETKKNRFGNEIARIDEIYSKKISNLKKISQGNRLLDIGAGCGTFLNMAKEAGFDVTGIELSIEQCKIAKDKYDLDFINKNIYEVKDNLGKFDIINLHHVLEHVKYPSKMFEIIDYLLKENGILLVEVPFQLRKVQEFIRPEKINPKKHKIDHLFFYSPKTLKRYAASNGFKVLKFNQAFQKVCAGHLRDKVRICLRNIFHKITTKLWLPSGNVIELYCKKIK